MPPFSPNIGQIVLVALAMLLFVAGAVASLGRLHSSSNALRLTAKSLDYLGLCSAVAALVWHCIQRESWIPLQDNFQALCALGVLLAAFWMYVQRARPIFGLDWFLMPIVVLMLGCAVIFGQARPEAYHAAGLWSWTHLLSSFGGALAFAVAASVGCMYLIVSARLRHKPAMPGANFGNLERLEHVTDSAASLGFGLLTLGVVTGLLKILQDGGHTRLGPHWMTSPKVVLAFGVWIVYAIALHTPITPTVRGRKSAMLSIVGFVLMFLTMVAVQFMPGGR
jgi:ABC-type uncharacterized transport system permease subunit